MRPRTLGLAGGLGAAGGAGGAVAAALAAGWIGAILLITLILVPTAAICWILADFDRPQRLALLITTWRHGTPASPREGPRTEGPPLDRQAADHRLTSSGNAPRESHSKPAR